METAAAILTQIAFQLNPELQAKVRNTSPAKGELVGTPIVEIYNQVLRQIQTRPSPGR
jgi:hypothetical protein